MQRYYLRLTGRLVRQAHVHTSVGPIKTLDNSLVAYVKEARSVDKSITSILRHLDKKIQNSDEYAMIDLIEIMMDISGMHRHRFILQLQQGLSLPL